MTSAVVSVFMVVSAVALATALGYGDIAHFRQNVHVLAVFENEAGSAAQSLGSEILYAQSVQSRVSAMEGFFSIASLERRFCTATATCAQS